MDIFTQLFFTFDILWCIDVKHDQKHFVLRKFHLKTEIHITICYTEGHSSSINFCSFLWFLGFRYYKPKTLPWVSAENKNITWYKQEMKINKNKKRDHFKSWVCYGLDNSGEDFLKQREHQASIFSMGHTSVLK